MPCLLYFIRSIYYICCCVLRVVRSRFAFVPGHFALFWFSFFFFTLIFDFASRCSFLQMRCSFFFCIRSFFAFVLRYVVYVTFVLCRFLFLVCSFCRIFIVMPFVHSLIILLLRSSFFYVLLHAILRWHSRSFVYPFCSFVLRESFCTFSRYTFCVLRCVVIVLPFFVVCVVLRSFDFRLHVSVRAISYSLDFFFVLYRFGSLLGRWFCVFLYVWFYTGCIRSLVCSFLPIYRFFFLRSTFAFFSRLSLYRFFLRPTVLHVFWVIRSFSRSFSPPSFVTPPTHSFYSPRSFVFCSHVFFCVTSSPRFLFDFVFRCSFCSRFFFFVVPRCCVTTFSTFSRSFIRAFDVWPFFFSVFIRSPFLFIHFFFFFLVLVSCLIPFVHGLPIVVFFFRFWFRLSTSFWCSVFLRLLSTCCCSPPRYFIFFVTTWSIFICLHFYLSFTFCYHSTDADVHSLLIPILFVPVVRFWPFTDLPVCVLFIIIYVVWFLISSFILHSHSTRFILFGIV